MSEATSRPALRLASAIAAGAALVALPVMLPDFLLFQMSLTLTYAIVILGLNLLFGFNGQISLAQSAFFALGAYAAAILVTRFEVNYLATLPLAAVIAGLVGVAVGLPALRLPGLQLAIVTFGLAALVPLLILKLDGITKGVTGIAFPRPEAPAWFPGGDETWIYELCLAGMGVSVFVAWRLLAGDTGRTLRAIRDNRLVAVSLGIDATRVRLSVFAISAALAGLAGALFAILNGYVNGDAFQAMKSIDFLIGAVVGGITSITGALVGALFVVFVPEWASDFNPALAALIYGCCLLTMTRVARNGIVGLVVLAAARLGRRRDRRATDTRQRCRRSAVLRGRR